MQTSDFDRIVTSLVSDYTARLISKGSEYSTEVDRLHNFKVAAELQSTTPPKALGGMLAKHIVSIYDMLNSESEFPLPVWDEKIGDAICYLLILRTAMDEASNPDLSS